MVHSHARGNFARAGLLATTANNVAICFNYLRLPFCGQRLNSSGLIFGKKTVYDSEIIPHMHFRRAQGRNNLGVESASKLPLFVPLLEKFGSPMRTI